MDEHKFIYLEPQDGVDADIGRQWCEDNDPADTGENWIEYELSNKWQPIETAPKDGTELLGYREDAGTFMIRYTSAEDFLLDHEMTEMSEDCRFSNDWFCSDFVTGSRLKGALIPTHWMPLPNPPKE